MEEIAINFLGKKWRIFPRDEADVSVMREIFKIREYRLAEEEIKNAVDPIVDAGAHAGFFSIYCRALNTKVKIFALEPEKNNLSAIKKHLAANAVKNIKIIPAALAGYTGKGLLKISEDSHNHFLLIGAGDGQKTEVVSLPDFCRKNKIKKISLLKMDIEGGEREVFDSLLPDDFKLVNFLILEYHNKERDNKTFIEDRLRENGFGVQVFSSRFDKSMGFIFAKNKRRE